MFYGCLVYILSTLVSFYFWVKYVAHVFFSNPVGVVTFNLTQGCVALPLVGLWMRVKPPGKDLKTATDR